MSKKLRTTEARGKTIIVAGRYGLNIGPADSFIRHIDMTKELAIDMAIPILMPKIKRVTNIIDFIRKNL